MCCDAFTYCCICFFTSCIYVMWCSASVHPAYNILEGIMSYDPILSMPGRSRRRICSDILCSIWCVLNSVSYITVGTLQELREQLRSWTNWNVKSVTQSAHSEAYTLHWWAGCTLSSSALFYPDIDVNLISSYFFLKVVLIYHVMKILPASYEFIYSIVTKNTKNSEIMTYHR
jgi:hypothetical protein